MYGCWHPSLQLLNCSSLSSMKIILFWYKFINYCVTNFNFLFLKTTYLNDKKIFDIILEM